MSDARRMNSWAKGVFAAIGVIALFVVAHAEAVRRAKAHERPELPKLAEPVLSLSEQRDSIVAEAARAAGVPVLLALAVSHVENWTGDSMAVSVAGKQDSATVRRAIAGEQRAIDTLGAVGLMQVLPRAWWHSFEVDCGCGSLFDRRRNACKGVRVLRYYLEKHSTVDRALRGYHGSLRHKGQGDGYTAAVLERMTRLSLTRL